MVVGPTKFGPISVNMSNQSPVVVSLVLSASPFRPGYRPRCVECHIHDNSRCLRMVGMWCRRTRLCCIHMWGNVGRPSGTRLVYMEPESVASGLVSMPSHLLRDLVPDGCYHRDGHGIPYQLIPSRFTDRSCTVWKFSKLCPVVWKSLQSLVFQGSEPPDDVFAIIGNEGSVGACGSQGELGGSV